MTILEHIKELALSLTSKEKQLLFELLAEPANEDAKSRKPQSLRGIWHDKFPRDPDQVMDSRSWDALTQLLSECAVDTGVSDLAHQHDHYLYGIPKRLTDADGNG